ncbi:MAG: hypothetical protein ACK41E_04160 [Deinococcales bacterium]
MKKVFFALCIAPLFVACAPNNPLSSYSLEFAPASLIGAQITGSGKLVVSSNGSSRVKLELRGLPASSKLGAALLAGSCTNQGHIVLNLPDLSSDANGNGTLETNFKNSVMPTPAYVNVYQKAAADGYGAALACANLQ